MKNKGDNTYERWGLSKIKNNAPAPAPSTGKEEDVYKYALKEAAKGRTRPFQNAEFKGMVLYLSYLSKKDFESKYHINFVEYVKERSITKSEDSDFVIEAVIYVDEITGCLPRPADPIKVTRKLYQFVQTVNGLNPTDAEAAEKLKKTNKKNMDVQKALEQWDRYPRAYMYMARADNRKKVVLPAATVKVIFPYTYDYSAGVIL